MVENGRELWNRVDDLRGRISVRELAERAGIKENSLQAVRAMGSVPKLSTLYPIAKTLGTTMEWLYAGDNITQNFDAPLFQKLSMSQDLIDICQALVKADALTLLLVKRAVGLDKQVGGGYLRLWTPPKYANA